MTDQTQRRSRTRTRTQSPQTRTTKSPAGSYGNAGYKIAQQEAAKAKARRDAAKSGNAFRFYQKAGDPEREVIILDESLDKLFYMREHAIWDGKSHEIPCTIEFSSCPLCEAAEGADRNSKFKDSYYAMFLSVLDLTPYTIKNGDRAGQVIQQSRKLLPVKQGQIDEFYRVLSAAQNKHGTIRGVSLILKRDGDKEARHGKIIPGDNGMTFDFWPADELEEEFGSSAVIKDKKVVVPANNDITPYDFDKLFPLPDPIDVAHAWDLPVPEGSLASQRSEWEEDDSTAADDGSVDTTASLSTDEDPPARRSRRRASAEAEQGTRNRTRRKETSDDLDGDDVPY